MSTSNHGVQRVTLMLAATLSSALTQSAAAVELQYGVGTQSVVIAEVNLSPGPDATVGDAASASTGLLMGGVMDNFTFGNAGITSSVPAGTNAFAVMRTALNASGESFNAGPFVSTASIATGNGAEPFAQGSWTIDVLTSAGETAGTLTRIDVSALVAGSVNAFGDGLEASVNWTVTTDHGAVMSGSAAAPADSFAPFADAGDLTFFVTLGGSFTLDIDVLVVASGDSDGPSMGGDAEAVVSAAAVEVSATLVNTTALLVPLAQTRRVFGTAFADDGKFLFENDSDSDEALDFGPFDTGASAQAEVPDALGTGGGTQDSTILDDGINLSASAFATAESSADLASADGSGESVASIDFLLTVDSDYTLRGEVAAFDFGFADLNLRGAGDEIVGVSASGPSDEVMVNEAGTLPAGSYTLACNADGSAFGSLFSSEFAFAELFEIVFRLVPTSCPCACGDINGDGSSDLRDFAEFARCFDKDPGTSYSCRCSDLNADGSIDLDDHAALADLLGTSSMNEPPNCP